MSLQYSRYSGGHASIHFQGVLDNALPLENSSQVFGKLTRGCFARELLLLQNIPLLIYRKSGLEFSKEDVKLIRNKVEFKKELKNTF